MTAAPPTPPVTDAAAFVAELRRLKAWSGLSYRQLERRAAQAGHWLPYSTAATMLGRDRLPRAELVAAFVAACGLRGDEAEAWLDARTALVCGRPAAAAPPEPGRGSWTARRGLAVAAPTARGRGSWRSLRVLAAAVAAAVLGGASAGGAFGEDVETETARTALHASGSS
ncbi:hypothetical protein GCM10018785_43490 [Streptomyces longispororuber]|uniref:Helix-turn-helix domain-containing protein n=1 Tax=Streptomyces longispororuber TaxID=68230 RepID=A0A918ZV62_9ACTN|nr:hypothetical protein [Streptomyces longispororuber]GHE70292.1 hypothetical protein GCM10018785_43490 [Streptomyces longispororuber]